MNWMNANATRSRPSSIKVRLSKSAVLQTCFLLRCSTHSTLLTLVVIIFVGRGSCREILQVACVWYTVVDLPFFISLRGQEINFRVSQVFLSGGCDGDLCCWDALKLHVNGICENDLANSHVQMQSAAIPCWDSSTRKQQAHVTLQTWRCKRVLCGLWVCHCFRRAFAKNPLQINHKTTSWMVLGGAAPLD